MNLYFLCLIHEWQYLSIFRALYQCLSICARDLHWKLSLFYFYLQCKHIYSNNWCSNSISSCIKLKISKHCFLKYKNLSIHQNFENCCTSRNFKYQKKSISSHFHKSLGFIKNILIVHNLNRTKNVVYYVRRIADCMCRL